MKSILLVVSVLSVGLLCLVAYAMFHHHTGLAATAAKQLDVNLQPTLTSGPAPEIPTSSGLPSINAPANNSMAPVLRQAYPLVEQGKLNDALALLNPAIQSTPNDPTLYNARSFIYIQEGHLDQARQDLRKAIDLGDKTTLTKFDLAELDFIQKQYDTARPGFVALESDPDHGDLSLFKVFLCDLLAGHEEQASKELDLFNLAGSNASYYFANIAWDVYHKKNEDARTWLDSANRIYSPKKIYLYSYSLTSLGYLPLPSSSPSTTPSSSPSPSAAPSPSPNTAPSPQ